MSELSATFEVLSWEETEWSKTPKLSEVRTTYRYTGDFEGVGELRMQLAYRPEGSCEFVGVERLEGHLEGRAGSFVLLHRGSYGALRADVRVQVLEGAGTGELAQLAGEGEVVSEHEATYSLALRVRRPAGSGG